MNTTLKIDVKYYLSQQIHPVIMRLCSPLEDIDSKMIAEHLGIIIIILYKLVKGVCYVLEHLKLI